MKKIPLIIDVDPGIDDAVAIFLALYADNLDVQLITTTAGNVGIENVTRNTLQLLEFYKKSVPVARGADKPMARNLEDASWVHGPIGLGEYVFPEPKTSVIENHAVEAIKEMLEKSPEPLTIITMGPLTNLGLLLQKYPEIKTKIKELIFMGGSIEGLGNKTPYAEFNIGVDPEAAQVVFQSGVNLVMCPMEMGHTAYFNKKDIAKIHQTNYIGEAFEIMFRTYKDNHVKNGAATHDVCAVAHLIDPKMFKIKPAYVTVELNDIVKTGITICDFKKKSKHLFNMRVHTRINVKKFKKEFFNVLESIK